MIEEQEIDNKYSKHICPLTGAMVTIPFDSLYLMVKGEVDLDEFSEQALIELIASFASFLLDQDKKDNAFGFIGVNHATN